MTYHNLKIDSGKLLPVEESFIKMVIRSGKKKEVIKLAKYLCFNLQDDKDYQEVYKYIQKTLLDCMKRMLESEDISNVNLAEVKQFSCD